MNIFKKGKHTKRKETNQEIYNRLLKLTNIENDPNTIPYMKAQTAVDELCRYFLGDDWYIVDPLNNEQVINEDTTITFTNIANNGLDLMIDIYVKTTVYNCFKCHTSGIIVKRKLSTSEKIVPFLSDYNCDTKKGLYISHEIIKKNPKIARAAKNKKVIVKKVL